MYKAVYKGNSCYRVKVVFLSLNTGCIRHIFADCHTQEDWWKISKNKVSVNPTPTGLWIPWLYRGGHNVHAGLP